MNRTILKWIVYGGLFIVPFIPFFVSSSFFFPFITTKAFAWRIIVEVVFAAWVLLALVEPRFRLKKSPVLYALLAFLLIVGLADAFGVAPVKSFWSNFERMEGFVTLLHLGLYFVVTASVFSEIEWRRWWKTSLVASLAMSVYALLQMAGSFAIHQGGARVDGTLGNAEYLAVYMLIHIFIAVFYYAREKNIWWKWFFIAVGIIDAFILYETATRGAILGLMGGLLVAALFNLTNRENARVRKASRGYVALFVIIILGFLAFRTSSFVKSSPTLGRFASISMTELSGEGRAFVWPMALKGIAEKPVLGWGQDNFNYVFDEHYSPEMYQLEPWFDRAHNIFLDWGVQAGVLGLLAYLSFYAVFMWLVWKKDEHFTRAEKSILTGLLAAYFFNNFFVFDNLISYILFFSLLAYVHMRATEGTQVSMKAWSDSDMAAMALPVAVIALGAALYFINVRPIKANFALIDGLFSVQSGGAMAGAIGDFEKAYNESRLGRPEVSEQIGSNAPTILSNNEIPLADRNAFYAFAISAVKEQADAFPGDTRYQLLAGSFLSQTGETDDGIAYLKKAISLTPGKQAIYFSLAGAYLNKSDTADAVATLKQAYELDTADTDAETSYLAGVIYAGDRATETSLVADLETPAKKGQLLNTTVLGAYVSASRIPDLIAYLTEVGNKFPELKTAADQYIAQARTLQK